MTLAAVPASLSYSVALAGILGESSNMHRDWAIVPIVPSSSDPLCDVLQLTRATSVRPGGIVAGGRWALRFPPPGEIKFSLLAKGGCWFRLDGQRRAIRAEQGDAVLLPGRHGFIVGARCRRSSGDTKRLTDWPVSFACVHRFGDSTHSGLSGTRSGRRMADDYQSSPAPPRRSMMVPRSAGAENARVLRAPRPLEFDSLTIQREFGPQPADDAFVRMVHEMTLRAAAAEIPIEQTVSRLSKANLGLYVFLEREGRRDLVAYTLNELSSAPATIPVRPRVNYFCSAFLLPETRNMFSLYRMLGALRVSGGEEVLLMRTQNPIVMASFFRLCRRHGYRAFGPTSDAIPRVVRDALIERFGDDELVHRAAYPGRVSPREMARTKRTAQLMELIDPDRGDACVFSAVLRSVRAQKPRLMDVRGGGAAA
jgi:hypothetical protein